MSSQNGSMQVTVRKNMGNKRKLYHVETFLLIQKWNQNVTVILTFFYTPNTETYVIPAHNVPVLIKICVAPVPRDMKVIIINDYFNARWPHLSPYY